ncbi:hypothetical protein ALO48_200010 [Pseudomonas syringae pv. rhaphiolepidis]|nr:hypothetical protein ALO48_200010 [Pseudomonas syringae pv. rhaphiolepidis]KWS39538.1 hypothetical protein AL060_20110 [Pseudomonas syringae pv. rhaphiolepidis]
MDLSNSGDHIASTLSNDRSCLVIVGLMDEAAPGVNATPHVPREKAAHFSAARDERLRVHRFRNAVAPGNRIQCAQEIRHVWSSSTWAGVARSTRKLAERCSSWMSDNVSIFEFSQAVFVVVIGGPVAAILGE